MSESAEIQPSQGKAQAGIVPEIATQTAAFVDPGSNPAIAGICGHIDGDTVCRRITLLHPHCRCHTHERVLPGDDELTGAQPQEISIF